MAHCTCWPPLRGVYAAHAARRIVHPASQRTASRLQLWYMTAVLYYLLCSDMVQCGKDTERLSKTKTPSCVAESQAGACLAVGCARFGRAPHSLFVTPCVRLKLCLQAICPQFCNSVLLNCVNSLPQRAAHQSQASPPGLHQLVPQSSD